MDTLPHRPLMSNVTTGGGEVALMNVPQRQVPTTLFMSSVPMLSKLQQQPLYEPHVQTREISPNIRRGHSPSKEYLKPRSKFIKDLFLTAFGIIICAIPLAIISTLYVQQNAMSSSSSTSTMITVTANVPVTSFTLPSQCTSYITNNDSTRNIASGLGAICDNWLATGWYRFMGGAGTKLATNPVSRDTCTTYYGGSYNGSLPLTAGSTTLGNLCLNNNGILCYAPWSGALIRVTNCDGYYVYYLSAITNCNSRYCTTY